MKLLYSIALTIILMYGCTYMVPYETKWRFYYYYDNEYTGLDTLINLDGFYHVKVDDKSTIKRAQDTLYPSYVFYKNGYVNLNTGYEYLLNKYDEFSHFDGMWGDYGRYILVEDTIKLQYIMSPGGMSRGMAEIWFKIIDENTIRKIYQGRGDYAWKGEHPYTYTYLKRGTFVFAPLDTKIEPEKTWLMKRRWFWSDKEEYKKWKRER